mgnify:CR=1 FL=1
MTPTEARLTFTGQGVWCVGTVVALALLLRPGIARKNNDNNNNRIRDGRWRVITPAFSMYLMAHAVASLLNMTDTAPHLVSVTNANVANVSVVNTMTTATANGDVVASVSIFVTATAIPVYVLLATRLLTPRASALRPLRFAIVAGAIVYLCFVLIVTLSSVAPVVVLFAFYLFAAVYGAIALVRYESCDERSPMYQPNPVCGRRCRRPLLLATAVGVMDFLLPAFAFLAGNDLAVAWLSLVGRLGDVVGYLPIVVQTFRYIESDARRDSLPLENPWLFWKCCDVDEFVDGDGVR